MTCRVEAPPIGGPTPFHGALQGPLVRTRPAPRPTPEPGYLTGNVGSNEIPGIRPGYDKGLGPGSWRAQASAEFLFGGAC